MHSLDRGESEREADTLFPGSKARIGTSRTRIRRKNTYAASHGLGFAKGKREEEGIDCEEMKEKREHKRKERSLQLFSYDKIVCISDTQNSTKVLLQIINTFRKVSG